MDPIQQALLDQHVLDSVQSPFSAEADGQKVQAHNLKDLIAAAKYLKGQETLKRKSRGLVFNQLLPPGTV